MYTKRTVTSRPGLTQEEALMSLQDHPEFTKRQARISNIRRRGDRWVATILEPKTAGGFPPGGDDEAGGPPKPESDAGPDGPPSDDGGDSDAPPSGDGEDGGPPKEKGGEKAEIGDLLHLVQQIADTLGIVPADGAMGPGGPDDMGPGHGGPPAPPPHGGPAPGAGGPPGMGGPPPPGGAGAGAGRPLRPGQVANKPGVVPVGAPAFASTRQGMGPLPPGAPGGGGAMGAPPAAGGGPCPICGGPEPCPAHGGAAAGAGAPPGAPGAAPGGMPTIGNVRSFTASTHDPHSRLRVAQAKTELEAQFPEHKVRQIQRQGEYVRALLSR